MILSLSPKIILFFRAFIFLHYFKYVIFSLYSARINPITIYSRNLKFKGGRQQKTELIWERLPQVCSQSFSHGSHQNGWYKECSWNVKWNHWHYQDWSSLVMWYTNTMPALWTIHARTNLKEDRGKTSKWWNDLIWEGIKLTVERLAKDRMKWRFVWGSCFMVSILLSNINNFWIDLLDQ